MTRETGFGRGFIHFEDNYRTLSDMFLRTFFGRAFHTIVLPRIRYHDIPAHRRAPDINRSVLDWTENEPDRPFFIFINYLDPHDPYMPPEPFKGMFDATVETAGRLNTEWMVHGDDLTPEQIQAEVDAYDASIAYTDHSLQELLSGLQEQGLADNLLVILTSDHGESFKEHGVFLHGNSL